MGFIEEMERRKQQVIQQELSRKAELERQQQIADQKVAQEAAEENKRLERISRGFLKDCPTITSLLDQLYQFGYKGYFEDVSKISGFNLKRISYTEYPDAYFDSTDRKIPMLQLPEKGSELTKQQLGVRRKLEDAFSQLGWYDLVQWNCIEEMAKNPRVVFFGDNVVVKVEDRELTEPQEVGIGIRFLKYTKTEEHRNRIAEFFHQGYDYLVEKWYDAVYVRIGISGASITGSTQQHANLQDINSFDRSLYQAFSNPAKLYASHKDRWEPPRPYPFSTSIPSGESKA